MPGKIAITELTPKNKTKTARSTDLRSGSASFRESQLQDATSSKPTT